MSVIDRERRLNLVTTNRPVLVLALATLLVGTVYSWYLGNQLRYPDERDYYALALHLSHSFSYTLDGTLPTTYRPPGYPGLLAVMVFFRAPVVLLRIVNYVALALSLWLVALILKERASSAAPVVGACLVCCYPVLFYTAGTLYPQTVAALLFLATLQLLGGRPTLRRYIGAGLLMAGLILTVPAFAVTVVALWIWLGLQRPLQRSYLVVLLAVTWLPVGAWIGRDVAVFHAFVFVSANSGENLLLGNSANTTPNAGVNVDISRDGAAAAQLNEVERDHYYLRRALSYVASHKRRAAVLYGLKLLNYFNYRNDLYVTSESSRLRDGIMFLSYSFLLILVVGRIVVARVRQLSSWERLLLLLYMLNALTSAVFFTRIRLRLPFDFLLILVAAPFLAAHLPPSLARWTAHPAQLVGDQD